MTVDDIELARSAEADDGITTRKTLRAAGYADQSIDRKIASGLLVPLLPGVYRVAGHPETWLGDLRAAVQWAGEDALITGASALALRGLDGFEAPEHDIYVAGSKTHKGVRTRRLPVTHIARRPFNGMWTTSIERALLDACVAHPAARVGLAMDDALRKGLTSIKRLLHESEVNGKRRGMKVFRKLIALRDSDDQQVRSVMETKMLRILRRIPTHRFVPNLEVRGRHRYFLDFAVVEMKLGIECHSPRWHGTGRVSPDMARHRELTLMGWTVLYFTWDDLVFRPEEVERDIRAALASSLPI